MFKKFWSKTKQAFELLLDLSKETVKFGSCNKPVECFSSEKLVSFFFGSMVAGDIYCQEEGLTERCRCSSFREREGWLLTVLGNIDNHFIRKEKARACTRGKLNTAFLRKTVLRCKYWPVLVTEFRTWFYQVQLWDY